MNDVEARREARRRRILENSENRLQKISGVEKRTCGYQIEGIINLRNLSYLIKNFL